MPLLVVAAALVPSTASAADSCRAVNTRTQQVYLGSDQLQPALDEIERGDTIRIQGRCVGSYVAFGHLRLIGAPTPAYPHPSLDADLQSRVLVTSRAVRIYDLTIKNGGRVPLGGGIMIERGSLFLGGRTAVIGNSAKVRGGGIDAENGDLTIAGHTVIRGNHSGGYGGGASTGLFGSVIVTDGALIGDNTARDQGGGIYASNTSVVVGGQAVISGNRAGQTGGGLADYDGMIELRSRASVVRNVAGVRGGGWHGYYSKLRICGPFVTLASNRPDDAPSARIVRC